MPLFLSHPVSTNLNKKMVQQIERSSKGDFFIKNRRLSISHVVCAVEMKMNVNITRVYLLIEVPPPSNNWRFCQQFFILTNLANF
jgi:hypothetical protein